MEIPSNLDFLLIAGLSREAREKLDIIKPRNVGQAMRLGGITPADIQVLMVALRNKNLYSEKDESTDCPHC
jgi:tRNA uridine 5-carboxymethylaminomethyl modification enzyme